MELCKYFLIFTSYVFYFVVGNKNDFGRNGNFESNINAAVDNVLVNQHFNYESLNKYGLGRKIIQDYRNLNPKLQYGYVHPATLPAPVKKPYLEGPFHTIHQGRRRKGDVRVFVKKFDFVPNLLRGQKFFCEALVQCTITYFKAETDEGIPILLRGGAGYTHLSVVVKSHSGKKLKGRVEAYCMKQPQLKGYAYKK